MADIDFKDRKILYQLDLDSRQSFRSIGRKVGLSKDTVTTRVKKMQDEGVIQNFYTIIDTSPLGYTHPRFYLNYQYVTPEIKQEIIDYFVNSKYVGFVHSIEGQYDLALVMVVKNVPRFNYFWERTMMKYRNYFANHVFSLYYRESMYEYSFLLPEDKIEKSDRYRVEVFGGENQEEIDDLDHKILKIITPNARIPVSEIAQKLDSTAVTINNRIKKLMKKGVIVGFKVNMDFPKLGYKFYKADINLKEPKKRNKIIKYVETNPYLNHIIKAIGYVDLELLFYLENANQLHEIMSDISVKFPDAIKNYSYFSIIKVHKWNYLPEK